MPKILLVEDDLLLLRMYQSAFKKTGLEVLNAIDGEEALETIKKEKPDLVLLDLVIPKMSGFDVLKNVKEDAETKNIPVICLSVLNQDEDIQKCKNLGADDYFDKTSVPPEQVVSKVQSRLVSS